MFLSPRFIKLKLPFVLLLCSSMIVYLPIILFPHWGLFSDAGQIILAGREFWADPWHRFDLIKGYWRPAFHIIDLITYKLFGENPLYFYLLECFMFLCTVTLTYLNCLILSSSRIFSTVFALFLLISTATLEVIYTLDKGEARIAFFLSLALFCYLRQDKKISKLNSSNIHYQPGSVRLIPTVIAFISVCLAFFTKETSQVVLVNLIALTLATFLLVPESKDLKMGFSEFFKNPRVKLTFFNNLSILFAFLLYKLFFYSTGGNNADNYLKIEYNLPEIYRSIIYYTKLIPDIIFILSFCMLSSLILTVKFIRHLSRNNRLFLSFSALHSLNLTVMAVVYFVALVNFRWKLVYIWFPINIFLLPATCYYFTSIITFFAQKRSFTNFRKYGTVLLVLVFLSAIPTRLIEAQAIFNLDALKDDLSKSLVNYKSKQKEKTINIALPFQVAESSEIGERIKFFVLENFFRVTEGRPFKKGDPFRIFNFLDYTPKNINYPLSSAFASSPEKTSTNLDESLISSSSGIQIFTYEMSKLWGSAKDVLWTKGMLLPGMYLLVPYGELPDTLHFRGVGMHQAPVESQLQFMPQVSWEEKMRVERSVFDIFGKKMTMGYKLLEVIDSPPISWNLFTDGWLPRKTELFFDKRLLNSVMTIQGLPFDISLKNINIRCNGNLLKNTAFHKTSNQGLYELQIDLTCPKSIMSSKGLYKIQIDVTASNTTTTPSAQDPRDLFFLVKKVYFSDKEILSYNHN
jgi:hypothetical protein